MEFSTEFPGPGPDDYANVLALNTAFLEASSELKGPQRGRLAAAPFLLFSIRENDLDWWERALADGRQGDLMAAPELNDIELRGIQSAAIGFLWQLARRNPYAARVISGATIAWCEKLISFPLVTLLDRVGARSDLMKSRLDDQEDSGHRLLGAGTSSSSRVRHSSHLVVLQSLLTRTGSEQYIRLPAAACRMARPRLKIAERKMTRIRRKKV
ncbi:MAG: hypothetical protein IIB75_02770 [Proteobacteria bacterium]|nr:hypothetical protein [Pseudomonadota bacterium]